MDKRDKITWTTIITLAFVIIIVLMVGFYPVYTTHDSFSGHITTVSYSIFDGPQVNLIVQPNLPLFLCHNWGFSQFTRAQCEQSIIAWSEGNGDEQYLPRAFSCDNIDVLTASRFYIGENVTVSTPVQHSIFMTSAVTYDCVITPSS